MKIILKKKKKSCSVFAVISKRIITFIVDSSLPQYISLHIFIDHDNHWWSQMCSSGCIFTVFASAEHPKPTTDVNMKL